MRLYAEGDYVHRLDETGFEVSAKSALELLGARTVEVYGLAGEEKVFFCTRA
jgi:hypothetical protein